jgi:hypothetical protein
MQYSGGNMANVSLRGLSEELKKGLKLEARRRNQSVNSLLLNLISKGVGLGEKQSYRVKHHDLDELAGTWSSDDVTEFETVTSSFNKIDDSLWK